MVAKMGSFLSELHNFIEESKKEVFFDNSKFQTLIIELKQDFFRNKIKNLLIYIKEKKYSFEESFITAIEYFELIRYNNVHKKSKAVIEKTFLKIINYFLNNKKVENKNCNFNNNLILRYTIINEFNKVTSLLVEKNFNLDVEFKIENTFKKDNAVNWGLQIGLHKEINFLKVLLEKEVLKNTYPKVKQNKRIII